MLAHGPRIVVLTGGHRAQAVDLFVDGEGGDGGRDPRRAPPGRRGARLGLHPLRRAGGALALGQSPLEAARTARRLAGEAVAQGLRDVGAGAGPVDVARVGGPSGVP